MFGHQIRYTLDVLDAHRAPVDLGGRRQGEADRRVELASQYVRALMQIIVSITILTVCFWMLVTSKDDSLRKIASGFIGTVVGYWLR